MNAADDKEPREWKGGFLPLAITIVFVLTISLAEIFIFDGWIVATLTPAGSNGEPALAPAAVLVATMVLTGVTIGLIGAIMRVVAHGRKEPLLKNIDLVGKMLAVSATMLALVGASGFVPSAVRDAYNFIGVWVVAGLAVIAAVYWLVRVLVRRARRATAVDVIAPTS